MKILSLFTLAVLASIAVLHTPPAAGATNPPQQSAADQPRQDAERRAYADAERRQDADRRQAPTSGRLPASAVLTDDLIGKPVISRKTNTEVGKVAKVLFNDAGHVQAAVIKRGGVMGFFSRELAIPWNELELTADGDAFVTDLDRSEMQTITAFQRGD